MQNSRTIKNLVYVTEMLRWGEEESHHYVVGVYTSREVAEFSGEVETEYRGGKYSYRVVELQLNANLDNDALDHYEKYVSNTR